MGVEAAVRSGGGRGGLMTTDHTRDIALAAGQLVPGFTSARGLNMYNALSNYQLFPLNQI